MKSYLHPQITCAGPNVATRLTFLVSLAVLFTCASLPTSASEDLSGICDRAATIAARETGVPLSVLQSISLTETGRKRDGRMRPWPWTVNMEGKGVWFDGQDEARAYVYKNYKRGARSFDVGCFQLNYKWHGKNFSSIEEMFEPVANARYAARFLLELFEEKGDWGLAAGAYHSRTPKYATKYMKRFEAYRAKLIGNDTAPLPVVTAAVAESADPALVVSAESAPVVRANLYPLLQSSGTARTPGSLVSLSQHAPARPLIVAQADQGLGR